jgi:hypothetical protein
LFHLRRRLEGHRVQVGIEFRQQAECRHKTSIAATMTYTTATENNHHGDNTTMRLLLNLENPHDERSEQLQTELWRAVAAARSA